MASRTRTSPGSRKTAHVVTIGISHSNADTDVVDALAADISGLHPAFLSAVCTPGSQDNAKRLFHKLKLTVASTRLVVLESHESLDEACRRTSDEIERLVEDGFERSSITLHYTAGTKVMAAGAVIAAVGAGVQSLRYLSPGHKDIAPTAVETTPRAVIAQRELRHSMELFFELRFNKSAYVAEQLDPSLLSNDGCASREVMRAASPAYHAWDNFRAAEFLELYAKAEPLIPKRGRLRVLRVPPTTLKTLGVIATAEEGEGTYPQELIFETWNSAIRRLLERRYDDALNRLYRASEFYAQHLMFKEYGLRSNNLEIRRVPPRSRAAFEAQRRLDDATIKIGHRESYKLLEVLGHPVGFAFRDDAEFQQVLDARRVLVLAHGVQPCPLPLALAMVNELGSFLELTIPGFQKRAAESQFPWIRNSEVLRLLQKEAAGEKNAEAAPPPPRQRR